MIAEDILPNLGIHVALNNSPKSCAFIRDGRLPAMIDEAEGQKVVWDKGMLQIGEKQYAYQQFHILDDSDPVFFNYIRDLITAHRQQQQFGFSFQ